MRMKRHIGHVLLLMSIAATAILSSCGSGDTVWTKSVGLPHSTWEFGNKLVFQPDSDKLEKNKVKKLVLFVRYKDDAAMKTLPLIIETESAVEGNEYSLDSINIDLFDKKGEPLGHGNYGIYEKADTFNLRYPIVEGWTLTANPASASEAADGIVAFGISLLK